MVQLIVGKKGKGKTRHLLNKANSEIRTIAGNIAYLDKNAKHMYELNNKIRLIDVSQYKLENSSEFIGFISGILSQDHDLQQLYLDNFLDIACVKEDDVTDIVKKLDKVGKNFEVGFLLSISLDESDIPESLKENIIVSC